MDRLILKNTQVCVCMRHHALAPIPNKGVTDRSLARDGPYGEQKGTRTRTTTRAFVLFFQNFVRVF